MTRVVNGDRVMIRRRWLTSLNRTAIENTLLLPVVWNVILLLMLRDEWQQSRFQLSTVPTMLAVAVGIFLAYLALATLCNTTTLELDGDILRVRSGPLPWQRPLAFRRDEISQVHSIEYKDRIERRLPRDSYGLALTTRSGKRVRLYRRIWRHDQCRYLLRDICAFFKLSDQQERR
jgi:hypothetical protein